MSFPCSLACTAALLLALGCSQPVTVDELREDAERRRVAGEFPAAVIQLNNAIRQAPRDARLHFELGRVHLEEGDLRRAEEALRVALERGAPKGEVLALLVDAWVEMERFQDVLDRILPEPSLDVMVRGHITVARARARLGLGKFDEARLGFHAAAATHPAHALVGAVHVAMGEGELPRAERLLAELSERHAEHAEGWVTRGNLRRVQGKSAEAREAFRQGAKAEPANPTPLLSLALMAASEGDFEEATKLLAQARKLRPSSPSMVFAEAFVALRQGKHAQANAALQRLARVIPEHLSGTLLSAMHDHTQGLLDTARQKYVTYLRKRPGDLNTRKLYARLLLKQGQPQTVLNLVQPALDLAPEDADLLTLAGEAHGQLGEAELAAQRFEQAAALLPNDPRVRSVLAASRLALGQNDAAIASLRHALEVKPDDVQAESLLVRALIARKDFDAALATAEALNRRHPRNPVALMSSAAALLARRDEAGARAAYERALSVDPSYFPAAAGLAQLDLRANQPELARKRFEAILAKSPKNLDATLALARLELGARRIQRARHLLYEAQTAHPDSAAVRIQLAHTLLKAHQYDEAHGVARTAHELDPNDFRAVEVLAEVQIARRDYAGAVATLTAKTASSQRRYLTAQLRLASTLSANGERRMAITVLQKLTQAHPGRPDVKTALGKELLREKRSAEALELARRFRAENPKAGEAHALEGIALLQQGKHAQAKAALSQAQALAPNASTLMLLHEAHSMMGGRPADERPLAEWLERNPGDGDLRLYLAWIHLARSEWRDAATHYLEVLKTSPENLMALNNMALALYHLGDRRARDFAERAVALRPNEAAVNDTLGMVLLAQGRLDEARKYLSKATSLAPEAPEIRYHLALAYLKADDKAAAKTALEMAIGSKIPFAERADAERTLKALRP